MLVHRRARRRGIGGALLAAAERSALSAGKTLLVPTPPATMPSACTRGRAGSGAADSELRAVADGARARPRTTSSSHRHLSTVIK